MLRTALVGTLAFQGLELALPIKRRGKRPGSGVARFWRWMLAFVHGVGSLVGGVSLADVIEEIKRQHTFTGPGLSQALADTVHRPGEFDLALSLPLAGSVRLLLMRTFLLMIRLLPR